MHKLLTRDQFREGVFVRDGHRCVICGEPARDAHHIMERRLFPDGGYYLANGASVCEQHHLLCERTDITVEDLLERIGSRRVTPPHLYGDQIYDKWGNPILPNGQRLRGELFLDLGVQRILADHLHEFTHLVKHPRTYHLPWSPGITDDDRVMASTDAFRGRCVIATRKMDGENTSMYRDAFHARSVDSRNHPSRNWAKQFWSKIAADIPEGWRIVAENLYAQHSIPYDQLTSYVYGFQIWDDRNTCLGWDQTLEWFQLLGITPVEVLYDGIYDERAIRRSCEDGVDWSSTEGYVLRIADGFSYAEFRTAVGKFVRRDHVQTIKHWMQGQLVVQNGLISG